MDYDQEVMTKEQKLENDFENCVIDGSAFRVDTAVYVLSLGDDQSAEVIESRKRALESSIHCKAAIDVISEKDMNLEQGWHSLCEEPEGIRLAENFANFGVKKKSELLKTHFDSLAKCLDETVNIINSTLAKKYGA